MSSSATGVLLRKANPKDAPFIFNVTKLTMRDYAIQTWGDWSESETRAKSISLAQSGAARIIELDGEGIGVCTVTTKEQETFIQQLYILPEFQNRGLGALVMQSIIESEPVGNVITLSVLKVNPAFHFYERLGFQETSRDKVRIYMACHCCP